MTADLRSHRFSRPTPSLRLLPLQLAAAFLILAGAAVRADAPSVPTPLANTASASPEIQPLAGEPQLLVMKPAAPGSTSPSTALGEGKVAAGRPVAFLLRPETPGLFSIGVSSPQNGARLSIYLGNSTTSEPGTTVADGAIRWSTELPAGTSVKIVVYTAGAEIPFRVEVIGGPGSL